MELDDRALPLTRGQLDIWLAQETGRFSVKWQLGMLGRIEGTLEPGLLERAIRQVVHEAEPLRAAFYQVDGQVFQKTVDYLDVELARYDLIASRESCPGSASASILDSTHTDAAQWPAVQICVVADAGR